MTRNEAPPLHPPVTPDQLEKMSPEERREYTFQRERAAIARYGGRPDLLLKENPHLDFRNPPNKKQNPAA